MKEHVCRLELKRADLRATPARIGVLTVLKESKFPIDIKDILKFLAKRHIQANKVTVFRIINKLVSAKLVTPIQLHEGKFRYEHYNSHDHHHFVCEKCRRIEDIFECTIDQFEKELQVKKGLLIKHHSLEFFGLCKNCLLL